MCNLIGPILLLNNHKLKIRTLALDSEIVPEL